MATKTFSRQVCGRFAILLSYPGENLVKEARSCAALLGDSHPAFASVERFATYAERAKPSRMEEIYTATFDLQPLCYPYVGYQLFGEGQQRTLFLIQLQAFYRRHGFTAGPELPDHLAEILRFLAGCRDDELSGEMIIDGLLPALDKLLSGFDPADHPYRELLSALQAFLTQETSATGVCSPPAEVTS
jgi:nitrate reductase delta subunit